MRVGDWRFAVTACGALAAILAVGGCADGKALGFDASKLAVRLSVTPGDGSSDVRPDSPLIVKAAQGRLENVTITTGSRQVEGTLSPDGTTWQARWTLQPGARYHVLATGLGLDGRTRTATGSFGVSEVKQADADPAVLTAPDEGETVGVGMPIIVHLAAPVQDRVAVEKALEVRSDKPVVGAWHWLDDQNVVFRTQDYWPIHTSVRFLGHLSGVHMGKNLYGTQDIDRHFTVGDAHISVASSDSHEETVSSNGKVIRVLPISMGRGGQRKYTTTNGVHLTMDKEYMTVMDSSTTGCGPGCPDYYHENVYWTVRISDSGEYEHAAPWSVGDQGSANVSHGCINLSTSNAIWFYRFSNRGDIVKVTGTSRELEPDNGWGFWQEDWPGWLRYTALHRAITTEALDGTERSKVPVAPSHPALAASTP